MSLRSITPKERTISSFGQLEAYLGTKRNIGGFVTIVSIEHDGPWHEKLPGEFSHAISEDEAARSKIEFKLDTDDSTFVIDEAGFSNFVAISVMSRQNIN